MTGGRFARCECGRLLIAGQTCVCEQHGSEASVTERAAGRPGIESAEDSE